MLRLLIALALAAMAATAAPAAPRFTGPNCAEASQLLPCLNQAVPGVSGVGSGATPLTINANSGVATFTGVTVAGVATGALVLNNNLVTAASQCVASIVSDNSAAASFPYIRSVVPTAGVLTINISNAAAATSTGSSTFGIAFFC